MTGTGRRKLFPKPCSAPGCPNLANGCYCEAHQHLAERYRGTAHQRGYDHRWRVYRKRFLSAHPLCAECGRLATVVDHIKAHKGDQDLFWDTSNHQSLCETCHNKKTATYDLARWDSLPPNSRWHSIPPKPNFVCAGGKSNFVCARGYEHNVCTCNNEWWWWRQSHPHTLRANPQAQAQPRPYTERTKRHAHYRPIVQQCAWVGA